ncbi:hypothetical protein [Clostridium sp.]|uniref:hypothetical protein n=1 Tax=Clostridium sp. TaxID=1506 RepID=UPI003993833A
MNTFMNANIPFKEIDYNFNMNILYIDNEDIINDYDLELNVYRGKDSSYIYGFIKFLNPEEASNSFINIVKSKLVDYKLKFQLINKYKLQASGKYIIKVPNNIIEEIQLVVTKK